MRLTAKLVHEILSTNKYVILRHWTGKEIGVNAGIINTKKGSLNFTKSKMHWRTKYISFRPCSFQEYISKKGYFIETN